MLCGTGTYPTTIKKCLKDVILSLCPLNYLLWHNFLGYFCKQCKNIQTTIENLKNNYKSIKTESCRKLFEEMEILPFYSQYILSLSMYVVNNTHVFTKNLEIVSHNTRSANNLLVPAANLTKYKK
jgi:hypothetical protein